MSSALKVLLTLKELTYRNPFKYKKCYSFGDKMKEEVFYGRGMKKIRSEYPEIYETIIKLNDAVFTGKSLDYKTQKLIAIGIAASRCDESATDRQMRSAMKELGVTSDEIVDVLRVVLLTSGMPSFTKGMRILEDIEK